MNNDKRTGSGISEADKASAAKAFFSRIVTPIIDHSSGLDLLDPLMVHLMEDESKSGRHIVPVEYVRSSVSSTQDVIDAVKRAKREKKVLRVVGSEHSVNAAIYPKDGITLVLKDDLRKVEILKETEEDGKKWLYCCIGGGCYLGKDPLDPHSTFQNSACYQVAVQGYGFPELGGIIQQSVGGFIMTGSAGGSLKHGFADVIQEIEFVDGNAQVRTAKPKTDLWCAVGVSMGLFGVITRVTFRLPPMQFIKGSESNHKFADPMLGPNNKGQSKLKESLEENEYMRVNWFPQKEVMRVQEWVGQQSFEKKDIVPYNSILSNILAAGMAAIALSICNFILQKKDPTALDYDIIGLILCQFVPLNDKPTKFYDMWYHALPMDNEAHVDTIIRVDFTEIWVPISQCQTVMDKLQKLFSENQKAANNFATEIYGAKSSPFWLSMSYQQDMVRVDPYWWAYNKGDARTFFSYFWDILLEIPGTRLHWGKYLPLPGQKCGNTTFNADYLKSVYPKMDDWLKLREQHDPDQVFMTDYWRGILGIKPKTQ
ncbi:unnamed protein product [Pocillopora meandrina]|uniref:FAD-binding PCMH-type domain-containing protein n=1 Tax=Pocillopora meandrina TaxID=46732 RepID=A0AAU9X6Y9_9CNID|nr:unnamed protein product [Pocillopora meandrina]